MTCSNRATTVLVVEHDEAMMREADQLIDFGPGAGVHGGRIVAQGTVGEVCRNPASLTGRYLSGELQIPVPADAPPADQVAVVDDRRRHDQQPARRRRAVPAGRVRLRHGRQRFGQEFAGQRDAGAGHDSPRWAAWRTKPGPFRSLRGASQIDKVVQIDQSPDRPHAAQYAGDVHRRV